MFETIWEFTRVPHNTHTQCYGLKIDIIEGFGKGDLKLALKDGKMSLGWNKSNEKPSQL